jgi:hypothetical protein
LGIIRSSAAGTESGILRTARVASTHCSGGNQPRQF